MPETTDFLYPFIEGDETDSESLLADLARSAEGKWRQSTALRLATLAASEAQVARPRPRPWPSASRPADGCSRSATGAAPPTPRPSPTCTPSRRGVGPLPARSLAEDQAVMTALGNDVGFELVFSRQLIAHGRRNDIAMGFSTSGNSDNLMRAFAEARKRACSPSASPATTAGAWPPRARRSTSAWSPAPTASTASRSPRPPSTTPCGPPSRRHWRRRSDDAL